MCSFSVQKYMDLEPCQKSVFNKALSVSLSTLMPEIENDDLLNKNDIKDFIANNGSIENSDEFVSTLYSNISAGIQVGSGNVDLYNKISYLIVQIWNKL